MYEKVMEISRKCEILSAEHDGDDNTCSPSQRYILGSANLSPGTEFNPWRFSPCSINYFTNFIKEKLSTSRGYTCLVYSIEPSADIPDVSEKLLGQLIKPDEQCQQIYGKNSYYCRHGNEGNNALICHLMFCKEPVTTRCLQEAALIGTSCGDGKICINGQCVSDPYAPQVDESCIFGDTPGSLCYSLLNFFHGNCYIAQYYLVCCSFCKRVSRSVKGCEYGDRRRKCKTGHCLSHKVDCCGTCKYGIPYIPTTSTRRTTSKRLATTVKRPVLFTPIEECKPGDRDLRPELCTSISVCRIQPSQCCSFCLINFISTTTTSNRTIVPESYLVTQETKTLCQERVEVFLSV
ncbi:uncharacterized protein LOC106057353 [Biomphalaria glabrata]|uniref:Uncharacterized protein LOC106057353 n=1 Tax=Biomphalaria glabrata TaxID=6526 RepID=A0A9U8E2I3_BIOGL|nr:uncharacterized protein LOC106057353 [Biomphalaria glabrata]